MRRMNEIKELQKYFSSFDEGYGTEYERYALNRFISQMIDRYSISKVLEMPANGVMGIPGIKSMIFAKIGCEVTVAHPSREFLENAKKIWDAFGLDANFVKTPWINSVFEDNSFDLVWNFCVFEHFDDPKRVIQEMLRITRRYIFIEIQNVFNPGFPIHRFYHFIRKEPWDHGSPSKMKLSRIRNIITELNATTVETGATDMPPWPDINMRLQEVVSKKASDLILNEEPVGKLRPAVKIKPLNEIINGIHLWGSAPSRAPPAPPQAPEGLTRKPYKGFVEKLSMKKEIVHHLFDRWYRLVESKAPPALKKIFAHHPYIIAEKRRWR
jgi:ubiquinone/menaquinone biosynthesis C-methylase UbiE